MDKYFSRILNERLSEIMKKTDLSDMHIYVAPANEFTVYLIRELSKLNYTVKNVIDSNEEFKGQLLEGIEIVPVEEALIPYKDNNIVLLTDSYDVKSLYQMDFLEYWHNIKRFLLIQQDAKRKLKVISIIHRLLHKRVFIDTKMVYRGRVVYKQIMKKSKEKIFLFPHRSIGDIYILGLYKKSDVDLFKDDHRLVVIGNACLTVAQEMGFKDVIAVSQYDMDSLCKFAIMMGESTINCKILHYDYYYTGIVSSVISAKKMIFSQCYDNMIIGQPWNKDKSFAMNCTNVDKYCEEAGLIKGKSVIIAPYAKSIPLITPPVWETIARLLKEKGLDVYTNCANDDEMPIYGTKRLSFSFKDAISIVDYAGYFVGIRSGLCDFISSSSCKKLILFPKVNNMDFSIIEFYSFSNMIYAKNILECECGRLATISEIEKYVNIFMEDNISEDKEKHSVTKINSI